LGEWHLLLSPSNTQSFEQSSHLHQIQPCRQDQHRNSEKHDNIHYKTLIQSGTNFYCYGLY